MYWKNGVKKFNHWFKSKDHKYGQWINKKKKYDIIKIEKILRWFLVCSVLNELNNNTNKKLKGIKIPIILEEVEKAQNNENITRSKYLLLLLNLK